MSSILLSECILPCLISTTPLDKFQLNKEPDMCWDHNLNMKVKTLLQRIGPKDPGLDPPSHRGLQKSEPLMNISSPGSHLKQPRMSSSLTAKNLPEKWSKTMPLTLNSKNLGFSAPNEYLNFLTWNGTMSLLENLSTLMPSSPVCTPPPPTAEPLRTLVSLNSTSGLINQPNRSRRLDHPLENCLSSYQIHFPPS